MLLEDKDANNSTNVLSSIRRMRNASKAVLHPKDGVALHAMVLRAGIESAADCYDWHGLKRGGREFALFQYTLSGEGCLCHHGTDYRLRKGSAMILHIPDKHRYYLPANHHWRFFYLLFNGSELIRLWRTLAERSGPVVSFEENSSALQFMAQLCRDILKEENVSRWENSSRAYESTMRLMEELVTCRRKSSDRPREIQCALDQMAQSDLGLITVDDLANAAGYSRFHFTRIFKAHEGMAPGQYIQRERLRLSVRLLQTTTHSVKEIAATCGFRDSNYFCRAFHKFFGVSPGVFRRNANSPS